MVVVLTVAPPVSSFRRKKPFEMELVLLRREPVLLLIEPLKEGEDCAELLSSSRKADSVDDNVSRLACVMGVFSASLSPSAASSTDEGELARAMDAGLLGVSAGV